MSARSPGPLLPDGMGRLARALLLREVRSRPLWAAGALLVLVAVMGGWQAGAPGGLSVEAAVRGGGNPLTRHFATAAPGVVAFVGALLVQRRFSTDHADRWLTPLLARGVERRAYPVALAAVLMLAVVGTFWLSVAAFGVTRAVAGSGDLNEVVRLLAGGSALIVSVMAFAAALSVLWPAPGTALVVGFVALALPFLVTMAVVLRNDAPPPALLHHALFIHLPPLSSAVRPAILLRHLAYVAAMLFLMLTFSDDRVARYS